MLNRRCHGVNSGVVVAGVLLLWDYGPNGTYPQYFDDYQASEDTILLLAEPGWWNGPNKPHTIPQAGSPTNVPPVYP